MTIMQPFYPHYSQNKAVTANTVGTTPAGGNVAISRSAKQVRIMNTGPGKAYVRTYDSTATPIPIASNLDYPVAAGQATIITKNHTHDMITYISLTDATLLDITPGEGF